MKHLSYIDIETAVKKIMTDLRKDEWVPDYIVAVEDACIPSVMLSHLINCEFHHLKTDGSWYPWIADDLYGYDVCLQKNVLFVFLDKDVGFLEKIKTDMLSACLPNSTKWDDVWNNNARFASLTGISNSMNYTGAEYDNVSYPWEITE